MSYAKATAPKTAQDYKTEIFELKKELKDATNCIKMCREDYVVNQIEHIQDIVALKYAYGCPIEDTLKELHREDLLDFLTNAGTGLNTKDYELGHALPTTKTKTIKEIVADRVK